MKQDDHFKWWTCLYQEIDTEKEFPSIKLNDHSLEGRERSFVFLIDVVDIVLARIWNECGLFTDLWPSLTSRKFAVETTEILYSAFVYGVMLLEIETWLYKEDRWTFNVRLYDRISVV